MCRVKREIKDVVRIFVHSVEKRFVSRVATTMLALSSLILRFIHIDQGIM